MGLYKEKQRLADLQERLANEMKNQEQLARDLNQVRYSLKTIYQKFLTDFNLNIESYKKSMETCDEQINTLRKKRTIVKIVCRSLIWSWVD